MKQCRPIRKYLCPLVFMVMGSPASAGTVKYQQRTSRDGEEVRDVKAWPLARKLHSVRIRLCKQVVHTKRPTTSEIRCRNVRKCDQKSRKYAFKTLKSDVESLKPFKSDLKSLKSGPASMKPDVKSLKSLTTDLNSWQSVLQPLEYLKSLKFLNH